MADSSVVSGVACAVCWLPYKIGGSKDDQPVSLACGHTFCRRCLQSVKQNKSICPKCRTLFSGELCTNYALLEVLEAAAEANAQPIQAASSTAAQVAEMASKMAAMQLLMNTREAASRREAAELQRRAVTMQAEMQRMTLSLSLAQQRAPTATPPPPTAPPTPAPSTTNVSTSHSGSGGVGGGSSSSSAQPPRALTASHTILNLKSDDLEELLQLASNARGPTVINLCGRSVKYSGSGNPIITGDNLTLRNGTIHLAAGPTAEGSSLCIQGTGVEMHGIIVCGGYVGLWVNPGSEVTLRECEVRGAYIGLWVGVSSQATVDDPTQKPAKLTALRLKVWGTGAGSGIGVGIRGSATLEQCEISGGDSHGILVCGDAPSRLTATNSKCFGNGAIGVVVHQGAHVVMTHCNLNDNKDGSLVVRHLGSRARLVSCLTDVAPCVYEGGVLEN